jgi:hypothetical protein
MPLPNERRSHSFFVRVWYEPDPTSEGQWRGSIEHIPSGQQMYFVSLADMSDFIALRLRDLLRIESSQAMPGDPKERN